jgi:hypothetical protein
MVVVVQRADGHLYPPELPTEAELERIRGLSHALRHRGLSYRQVQRALADQHAIRRSVGSIHNDLTAFCCDRCAS